MSYYEGKIVVITGAAGGIGRALVARLLKQGATVWASDVNADAVVEMEEEARKHDWRLHGFCADVTNLESLKRLREKALEGHERIDVWINNAGIAGIGGFMENDLAAFEKVMQVNFNGVLYGTRLALECFDKQGAGAVVNIASVAGHVAPPFMSAYAASKHAVVALTRAVREEMRLHQSNVKVVLVSPGFVDTAILSKGEKLGFPTWLDWALASPDGAAKTILDGVRRGVAEIYPTWNGKVMMGVAKFAPAAIARGGSKLLLARNFKDYLLNRYRL